MIDRLTLAGFANIEVVSFVSPKWVPQMATSTEVRAGIMRKPGGLYSELTPNMKGFEAAMAARAAEVVIFGSASEAFSQKNINRSIAESIERWSGHFHDTYGQGIGNSYASQEVGLSIFHWSVAGLGGCPYAKSATGNVATEDVLFLMQGLGIDTGIDLNAVVEAGQFISRHLGRKSVSRAGNALAANLCLAD